MKQALLYITFFAFYCNGSDFNIILNKNTNIPNDKILSSLNRTKKRTLDESIKKYHSYDKNNVDVLEFSSEEELRKYNEIAEDYYTFKKKYNERLHKNLSRNNDQLKSFIESNHKRKKVFIATLPLFNSNLEQIGNIDLFSDGSMIERK